METLGLDVKLGQQVKLDFSKGLDEFNSWLVYMLRANSTTEASGSAAKVGLGIHPINIY